MIDLLVPAGDDSFPDQAEDPVSEHFCVYPEIFVAGQLRRQGVRKAANAHLQAGAIGDKLGAVLSDKDVSLRRFRIFLGKKGSVVPDQVVESVQRNQIAISEGHVRIDNSDLDPRRFDRGGGAVD